jgi:integrase
LDKLTPEQIQGMYFQMTDRGLSSSTIRNTHAVLNSALKQAVRWGKLFRNPAELIDLPRKEKNEMKVLSKEEATIFLDAIVNSGMKALFSLMITTGLRPGEALGLKWQDVDFDRNRNTVNRSLSRSGGKWKLVEPKTASGRRSIPVPRTVMNDLHEHKNEQLAEKNSAKPNTYKDQGFVLATKTGEPLSDRNIISRHFKPLLKSADLPDIRLYDLRHTRATLLLLAGENPKMVSERLGHADTALTLNTYSHVLPDMQEDATRKLENMLFNNK